MRHRILTFTNYFIGESSYPVQIDDGVIYMVNTLTSEKNQITNISN